MNGSRNEGKSESNEEQIKNAYNSLNISNETPKYYKELLKSYEERNNNKNKENTNSRDEIGERIFNINEGVFFPNFSVISSICPKEYQKQKENEDKSNEGLSFYDSFFFLLNGFLNQKEKKSLIKQDNINGTITINSEDKKILIKAMKKKMNLWNLIIMILMN